MTWIQVTAMTIGWRFRERCLSWQLPLHYRTVFEWYVTHSNWNLTNWSIIVFSAEVRFELSTGDQQARVWRKFGQSGIVSWLTPITQPIGGFGNMVWGRQKWDTHISYNDRNFTWLSSDRWPEIPKSWLGALSKDRRSLPILICSSIQQL